MSLFFGWLHSARSILRRRASDRETSDEISFHIEQQTRKHLIRGLSPEDARVRAMREFGGVGRWREETRNARRGQFGENLVQDVRYAMRVLLRRPGFASIALFTLSVGLGVTITAYSTLDHILWRSLPYRNAAQLVALRETNDQSPQGFLFSVPNFLDLQHQTTSFAAMGLSQAYSSTVIFDDDVAAAHLAAVSGDFFKVFGVAPALGQWFAPGDPVRDGFPRVVISDRAWRGWFAGDRALIGKSIRIGATSYTVIGVAPPAFDYPINTDMWVACTWCATATAGARATPVSDVVARLSPGVSLERATADINRVGKLLHQAYPDLRENQMTGAKAIFLKDVVVAEARRLVLLPAAAVALLLLIGCGNLASANLARHMARQPEIALRRALGASRWRVIQPVLVESLLLSAVGTLLGFGVAIAGVHVIAGATGTWLPRLAELRVDWRSAVFAVAAALAVAMLVGLPVAWQFSSRDVWGSMGHRGSAGRSATWMRQTLIGFEVALAMVLLVGAGLAFRSLSLVLHEPLGIDRQGIVSFQPHLGPRQYPTETAVVAFYDNVLRRLRQTPGIISAAYASAAPLQNQWFTGLVEIEGNASPVATGDVGPTASFNLITDDFFSTLRIPLLRGRLFTMADDSLHPDVTVINRAMAEKYWPGQDPIGKRFRALSMTDGHEREWLTVVGVVSNVRYYSLEAENQPVHYVSIRQRSRGVASGTVIVRSSLAASATVVAIRRVLREVAPEMAPLITTLADRIDATTGTRRLLSYLFTGTAAAALVLVCVGVYGVLSYLVVLRTREIGVRMALGATIGRVVLGILSNVVRPVLGGLVAGLVIALLLSKALESLVYKIRPTDPWVLAGTAAVLAAVVIAASLIPARRAAMIDPMVALRAE